MRVYITNINGQSLQSTAQLAQNVVTDIASTLGYRELGIYAYNFHGDSENELSKRLDGIVAGLRHGDVVIFQTPTWNTTAFDERVMNKLKAYQIKIVVFVHDVVPLMFAGNYYLMDQTVSYYNKADVIVVPSQQMLDTLRDHGLTVKKAIIQGMWDHPTQVPMKQARLDRKIHFPGDPVRFSFITKWNYSIPLHLYSSKQVELPDTVVREPWRFNEELLMDMSQGGFGLVWMDDHDKDYQKLYCPYKLASFIAAGIPVFVQRGIANQEIIENNNLGWVVDSLDEVVEMIQQMTDVQYLEKVASVRKFNPLIRQGYFTKKLLTDAVFSALCE